MTDDPYVATDRIHETARIFDAMGADVDARHYEDLGHAIDDDEIEAIDTLVDQLH